MMLLFCILLNVVVAIIFKIFPRYNIDVKRAIIVNYFTCVATAWAADYVEFNTHLPMVKDFVIWTLPMGILFFTVFLIIGKTVASFGVLVATTSQKLSLILPVVIALLFFDEPLTTWKLPGLLAAIGAVLYINANGSPRLPKLNALTTLSLPLLTWLGSSAVDLSLFLSEKYQAAQGHNLLFTASLFFFAGLSGLLFVIVQDFKTGSSWKKKDILAGTCLGIPNFFSIYLIVVLLSDGWQGSILFPMLNVAIILMTTLVGLFIFKEDFSRNRKAGIILAIFAIILLSLPWK
ncbi:MAG: hypothetical protein KA340_14380 [Saprospiraceae bacterium]|nr:hypothetical protein [Saprospiraceae bacterium]